MKPMLFYIFALIILTSSFLCVTSRRILRAAVFLLFVLVATGGIYFLFDYFFLGAIQLALYAGGIIVLIIFSVMLTSNINEKLEKPAPFRAVITFATTLAGAGICLFIVSGYRGLNPVPENKSPGFREISAKLISYGNDGYALPFEVISVLLLAAMVGAIIIAKKQETKEKTK